MNADEYRKLAEVEDRMWYFRALHAHVERELVAALGDGPAAVLDAGCGTGGLIRRLAPRHRAWRWTGLDLEPAACALARDRIGDAGGAGSAARPTGAVPRADEPPQIVEGSVTRLPFAAQRFDAVVSADVLYHLEDDAAALREFARVLRPGGVAVINVPAYRWLWSYHDVAVHSRRRYVRGEVIAKARAAGLKAVRATYWNTLPFPLVVARRKLFPAPAGGSDVHVFPGPVETAFDAAMTFERAWLRRFQRLPFGSSVFAVLRR